jgi:hypothetical protein
VVAQPFGRRGIDLKLQLYLARHSCISLPREDVPGPL